MLESYESDSWHSQWMCTNRCFLAFLITAPEVCGNAESCFNTLKAFLQVLVHIINSGWMLAHGSHHPQLSSALFFQDGQAPSTRKTYGAALKRFHSFYIKFTVINLSQCLNIYCAASRRILLTKDSHRPSDREIIPVSSEEHADCSGSPGPSRPVFIACIKVACSPVFSRSTNLESNLINF